jgi:hypothetical protein
MENKEFEDILENLDKIANKEIDSDPEGGCGEIIKVEEIKKQFVYLQKVFNKNVKPTWHN